MIRFRFFAITILFFVLLLLFFPINVSAQTTNCSNRFATLVNPVRSRSLWRDTSIKPLTDQYNAIHRYNFPATWLLQYDTLTDGELIQMTKIFDPAQEFGIFLEVSPTLAESSGIVYPVKTPWYFPNAVFFSGYAQSERRRLIDTLFAKFKQVYGYYPASVGAWWIDSYSLNYLVKKYHITTAMIVADQRATDNYGVWGQWWGVPYYPTKANVLVPANGGDKQPVVVIQWAQRDADLGYGNEKERSLYSMQANDYIKMGKTTDYFKYLSATYLNCGNKVGQITVGLETGMESLEAFPEYQQQLAVLAAQPTVRVTTMQRFGQLYKEFVPKNPNLVVVNGLQEGFLLTPFGRSYSNGASIRYDHGLAFADYFLPDKEHFLNRILPDNPPSQRQPIEYFWFVDLALLAIAFVKRKLPIWLVSNLFTLIAFAPVVHAHAQFGWYVYYGMQLPTMEFVKMLTLISTFASILIINRFSGILPWFAVSAYGFLPFIAVLRYTIIDNVRYIGFAATPTSVIGIAFPNLAIVTKHLTAQQSASALRIHLADYLASPPVVLILLPLASFGFALLANLIYRKLPKRMVMVYVVLLAIATLFGLYAAYTGDPTAIVRLASQ